MVFASLTTLLLSLFQTTPKHYKLLPFNQLTSHQTSQRIQHIPIRSSKNTFLQHTTSYLPPTDQQSAMNDRRLKRVPKRLPLIKTCALFTRWSYPFFFSQLSAPIFRPFVVIKARIKLFAKFTQYSYTPFLANFNSINIHFILFQFYQTLPKNILSTACSIFSPTA